MPDTPEKRLVWVIELHARWEATSQIDDTAPSISSSRPANRKPTCFRNSYEAPLRASESAFFVPEISHHSQIFPVLLSSEVISLGSSPGPIYLVIE